MNESLAKLRTNRLELRPPNELLTSQWTAYCTRNLSHFADSGPLLSTLPTDISSLESIRHSLQQIEAGSACIFWLHSLDESDSPIIGDISFTNIVRGVFRACYLGYRIDENYQGKGLMREALSTSIDHMFYSLNLHRIMANYVPTNERSGHLLRRLGFNVEGYARDYLMLNGEWKDHILTSLICQNSIRS